MIAIATASQKGGVGKTTLCINLAYALVRRGWTVLVVDTDPQSGIGLSLARSTRSKQGFYDFLCDGRDLSRRILTTRLPALKVLPAGQYDQAVRQGWPSHQVPRRLSALLRHAEMAHIDCVLLDTAAGLNGMTEAVIKASDYVIVPQQAEPLAVRSVPHMLETLARFRREGANVQVAGILLSMVIQNHAVSRKVAAELRALLPSDLLFATEIPRHDAFLEASAMGVPLALCPQPPEEAALFDQLAAELETRTGLNLERELHRHHASLLD